jgi:peptide/nickel transport system substrate-binding protein
MVKKDRFRLSILALLFVLPFVAACGSTTETPAAESSPATQAGDAAQESGAADAPAQNVQDVTVTLPFLEGGITSFDHAYWTSQVLVSQGTIFEGLYG